MKKPPNTKPHPEVTGLLFCGDPHGRFDHIVAAAERWPGVPVILLGDLEPQEPLPQLLGPVWARTWLIHGNHDSEHEAVARHVWSEVAQAQCLHARVVELASGLRVAGLGGVFRERVWHPDRAGQTGGQPRWFNRKAHEHATPRQDRWREGVPMVHWSSIYPDDWQALQAQRCDVLVVHEAPGYHPNGMPLLDELARAMGAKLVVHGHHHDRLDSRSVWTSQGFQSFGVGLRGITWIEPHTGEAEVVVPGELDEARMRRGALS